MLKKRVISSCASAWEAIKGTLCLDSPEGHQTNDKDEDYLNIGMKDTLSFAWRALKESRYACGIDHVQDGKLLINKYSLLLCALLEVDTGVQQDEPILSHNDFEEIGWLTFTQLAELRHRGAFSTVARTFAICCAKCIQAKDHETSRLPKKWYKVSIFYSEASRLLNA